MPIIYHPKSKKAVTCDPEQKQIMLDAGYLASLDAKPNKPASAAKPASKPKSSAKKSPSKASSKPAETEVSLEDVADVVEDVMDASDDLVG